MDNKIIFYAEKCLLSFDLSLLRVKENSYWNIYQCNCNVIIMFPFLCTLGFKRKTGASAAEGSKPVKHYPYGILTLRGSSYFYLNKLNLD